MSLSFGRARSASMNFACTFPENFYRIAIRAVCKKFSNFRLENARTRFFERCRILEYLSARRKPEAGAPSIFPLFDSRQILSSSSSFSALAVPSYLVRAESTAGILAAGDRKSIPDAKVIRKETPSSGSGRINVPLSRYKRPRWKSTSTFPLTYSEMETVAALLGPDVCSNAPE